MRLLSLPAMLVALALPAAAEATTTATGTFTAATDTAKPLNDTSPRGSVTFSQTGNGPITAKGSITGLLPNRAYLTVAYKDGFCAPTPGVSAFPSAPWTTDGNGAATFTTTVNPQAVNPAGQFTVGQTRSISIREVAAGSQQPPAPLPPTPNVPNPITEACDTNPVVNGAGGSSVPASASVQAGPLNASAGLR